MQERRQDDSPTTDDLARQNREVKQDDSPVQISDEATTDITAHREHRRENEQGSTHVEAAEDVALAGGRDDQKLATNDVDARTQSAEMLGSPMVPEGRSADPVPISIRRDPSEQMRPTGSTVTGSEGPGTRMNQATTQESLLPGQEAKDLRSKWDAIQTGFVDEPRQTVQQADHLVAETMQRIAQVFSDERGRLEQQWSRGDDVTTEELRMALRKYRTFFDRMLSI